MRFIAKSSHLPIVSIQNGPAKTAAIPCILEPRWNPYTNFDMPFARLATGDDGAETHNPLCGDGQG